MLKRLRPYWDTTFFVELLLLAITAPILYFPGRFGMGEIAFAVGLLALGWVWRRLMIGVWYQRTPADWPIFFLFAVMLPVSIWAAPGPLREEYSIPRALILIWNFFLFWTVVSHAGRRREFLYLIGAGFILAGVAVSAIALLGTQWGNKFPLLGPFLARVPTPLVGAFDGAESGFNPNQVAGTLLYILPLGMALLVSVGRDWRQRWWWGIPLLGAVGVIGAVFLFTQSRAAWLGLIVAVVAMLLMRWRRGLLVIAAGIVLLVVILPWVPFELILGQAGEAEELVGTVTLSGRQEIWNRALYGIADFSFTGMGLGTFREIVRILYPLFLISPGFDIGHAHNFFLQMGLDFGIPGLIALLAIYLSGVAHLVQVRLTYTWGQTLWAIGLLGVLLGHTLYDMADAVSMGAKPNFIFWMLLALVFAQRQGLMTGEQASARALPVERQMGQHVH
jgi:O-antigen ligase